MKLKKISLICLVSIMLILQCSVIASARSSDYLDAYGVYLTPQSGGKIVFTADVNALRDMTKMCNLLALEDKTARSLGINVNAMRIVISLIAVLLASISTAVAGVISFLGLIVPHIGRILVGSDHKALVPFSALFGAFTFLLADTIGRTIAAPYEVSASIIMSVVGGPFFIILLRRSKKYAK